jgi:hypothetical protein
MNGIFANYLQCTNYVFKRVWLKGVSAINILNHVIFHAKIQISKLIDVPYIRVYV